MPIGTPFHDQTLALCESLNYREWAGYYAVSAYESHHEHEYNAIRTAAALIDLSPLFKYMVAGPEAVRFVDRIITRDVSKMAIGQVYYTPWCDERGRVIDDGTVSRLSEQVFRWTAADPNLPMVPAERRRAGRTTGNIESFLSSPIAAKAWRGQHREVRLARRKRLPLGIGSSRLRPGRLRHPPLRPPCIGGL